ncbi:hypothetical protein GQ600_13621 [Phytophthora cactorum]|nr:hypothetical protein GQ600_13621 [Phytophthora cactorum]
MSPRVRKEEIATSDARQKLKQEEMRMLLEEGERKEKENRIKLKVAAATKDGWSLGEASPRGNDASLRLSTEEQLVGSETPLRKCIVLFFSIAMSFAFRCLRTVGCILPTTNEGRAYFTSTNCPDAVV